jgi:hypothetical protein
MTLGPVQVLGIGFESGELKGEVLDELKKLMEHDIVRLIDLLIVQKQEDGTIIRMEISDQHEISKLGTVVGALLGLGVAGEEGALVGAELGAEAAEKGTVFDEEDVWYLEDALPVGVTTGIAVLEHRWAIPLRDAIVRAKGVPIVDQWIHPLDIVAIGAEIGMEI